MVQATRTTIVVTTVLLGTALCHFGRESGMFRVGIGDAFGADEAAAAKKIANGKPTYKSKGGNEHWKEQGRIVTIAKDRPDYTVDVISSGKVVETHKCEVTNDGKGVCEVWLKPGTYAIKVTAKGYEPLVLEDLEVKTDNDLVINLEF
jgi:hypothetical protein